MSVTTSSNNLSSLVSASIESPYAPSVSSAFASDDPSAQQEDTKKYHCTYKGCDLRLHSAYLLNVHEAGVHQKVKLWRCKEKACRGIRQPADFTRKAELVQHVDKEHFGNTGDKEILKEIGKRVKDWQRDIAASEDQPNMTYCGFCKEEGAQGREFGTRHERYVHVARHFAAGLTMDDWMHRGD